MRFSDAELIVPTAPSPEAAPAPAWQLRPAAHLGRWLGSVGALGGEDEVLGNVITEERLRALWEETRAISP